MPAWVCVFYNLQTIMVCVHLPFICEVLGSNPALVRFFSMLYFVKTVFLFFLQHLEYVHLTYKPKLVSDIRI